MPSGEQPSRVWFCRHLINNQTLSYSEDILFLEKNNFIRPIILAHALQDIQMSSDLVYDIENKYQMNFFNVYPRKEREERKAKRRQTDPRL